jgi:hypothetical protein
MVCRFTTLVEASKPSVTKKPDPEWFAVGLLAKHTRKDA